MFFKLEYVSEYQEKSDGDILCADHAIDCELVNINPRRLRFSSSQSLWPNNIPVKNSNNIITIQMWNNYDFQIHSLIDDGFDVYFSAWQGKRDGKWEEISKNNLHFTIKPSLWRKLRSMYFTVEFMKQKYELTGYGTYYTWPQDMKMLAKLYLNNNVLD